jgi:hypothetical protein
MTDGRINSTGMVGVGTWTAVVGEGCGEVWENLVDAGSTIVSAGRQAWRRIARRSEIGMVLL